MISNLDEDTLSYLSPNLVATLHETRLLLNPDQSTAVDLLTAYMHPRMIYTFPTQHWTYKAAMIIVTNDSGKGLLECYGKATAILTRCARQWPSATALLSMITSYIRQKQKP